jgi:Domain of unknown function (DUF4129)
VEDGETYGAGRAAVVAVVSCLLLVAALVAWAATIGAGTVIDNPDAGRPQFAATATPTDIVATSTGVGADPPLPSGETPVILKILGVGLVVAFCLLLLVLLGLAVRFLWQLQKPERRPKPDQIDFDLVEAPERIVDAMLADAGEQRRLLLGGNPRNGIVECWGRFETQAASAGMPRRSWETSSEYTLRLLDLVAADDGAVNGLAGLFREARFSEHQVTEDDRQRAVAALDRIHASLLARPVRSAR